MAARVHPVDIAAKCVNFTVVAQKAKGLGQAPRGEGVG